VAAAIGISGPLTRIRTDMLDEYIGIVRDVARELSMQLGYGAVFTE
jgi:DNA-binding IclR family transcriptional regulator